MKAKLVKRIPHRADMPYYFREYEFECIDCGAHYRRKRCDGRTSPYCCACKRKHDKEKQEERKARRDRELIGSVIDKIRAEIETKYGDCSLCEYYSDHGGSYEPIGDVAYILQIIDKYKAEQEK